jgi:hypothetical protein
MVGDLIFIYFVALLVACVIYAPFFLLFKKVLFSPVKFSIGYVNVVFIFFVFDVIFLSIWYFVKMLLVKNTNHVLQISVEFTFVILSQFVIAYIMANLLKKRFILDKLITNNNIKTNNVNLGFMKKSKLDLVVYKNVLFFVIMKFVSPIVILMLY